MWNQKRFMSSNAVWFFVLSKIVKLGMYRHVVFSSSQICFITVKGVKMDIKMCYVLITCAILSTALMEHKSDHYKGAKTIFSEHNIITLHLLKWVFKDTSEISRSLWISCNFGQYPERTSPHLLQMVKTDFLHPQGERLCLICRESYTHLMALRLK